MPTSAERFETGDAAETEALGERIARELRPGDLVLIRGELGTGKTTLVRGAAHALGVIDPVTSPTFSLGHRYNGDGVTVAHLDLYRLGDLADEVPDLLDGYTGPDCISFVEWPQQGGDELGRPRLTVELEHAGGDRRSVVVRRHG